MDSAWQALRTWVVDEICKSLEKKQPNQSSEWKQRLLDIAKKLEESFFNESINKGDYIIKIKTGIELRIKNILNEMRRHQQTMAHHNLQSNSSTSGMMIPTPSISHNPTGTMQMLEMENNWGIKPTSGTAGTMSNGYQLSNGNMPINQPESSSLYATIGVRHQVTPQMIPTPGFNSTGISQVSQQTMPVDSDYNNVSGSLGADSSMLMLMQPQKQQQYNNLGGQLGLGVQGVPTNQRHPCQGFGDGMLNNMQQLMNGPGMSEGYIGIGGTYGNSTEPIQQHFSSQHIQERMPSTMFNRYQILHGKMPINEPAGSSSMLASKVVPRPVMPQMILNRRFNSTSTSQVSQQTMPMNSDYNNGYNNLDGQVGPGNGMQSVSMNHKQSSQEFGDGMMNNNNGLGSHGNNMQQLMNGPHGPPRTMSNGNKLSYRNMPINQPGSTAMSATSMQCQIMPQLIQISGFNTISTSQVSQHTTNWPEMPTHGNSTKPVLQGSSSQKNQQRIMIPSKQGVSMMNESIVTEQVEMTRKYYNPAGPSNMSSVRNLNKNSDVAASGQSRPRSNTHTHSNQESSWHFQHATQRAIHQPTLNSVPFTNPEKFNLQSYAQMSSQQNSHIGGTQQQPHQQQLQPMMISGGSNIFSGQSSLDSIHSIGSFGAINTEQAMADIQPVDFEKPVGNNSGSQGQFLGPLAGSNALNHSQSDELSSHYGLVNGQLWGGGGFQQPDSTLLQCQAQRRPTQQMQRNNQLLLSDNNNSNLSKISAASLPSKPRPNMLSENHQAVMQQKAIKQPIKISEPLTNPEKVNIQPYAQMSSQLNNHHSGNQVHQKHQHRQQQPMMIRGASNTFPRQSSLGSIGSIGLLGANNTEQIMVQSALLMNCKPLLPHLADFQVPHSNNNGEGCGQFSGLLASLSQGVQSDELSSHNRVVNGRSTGGGAVQQPDSMLVQKPAQHIQQVQQMQRNNRQMIDDNNNSNNDNVVIEKNQVSQNEPNQSCMAIYSPGIRATAPTVSTTSVIPTKGSSLLSQQEMLYRDQVKLILLLHHARSCFAPVGHCPEMTCVKAKQFVKHIDQCSQKQCRIRLCLAARRTLLHFHYCQEVNCPVCIEALKFLRINKQKLNNFSKNAINVKEVGNEMTTVTGLAPLHAPVSLPVSTSSSAPPDAKRYKKRTNQFDASSQILSDQLDAGPGLMDVSECCNQPHLPLQQPLPKRRRISMDISSVSVNNTNQSFSAEFPTEQSTCNTPAKHELVVKIDPASQNLQITSDKSSGRMGYYLERNEEIESEPKEMEMEDNVIAGQSRKPKIKDVEDVSTIRYFQTNVGPAGQSVVITPLVKKQESLLKVESEKRNDENSSDAKEMEMEDGVAGKSMKSKIRGVSLIDFFTPEQVREHQKSIKQWVGQDKAMAQKKQPILNNDNLCQLCGLEKLSFEPPRKFCYLCGAQIKRCTMYYTTDTSDEKHICIPCVNETRGETIEVEGDVFPKAGLEKIKNDEAIGEPWVQCDKCQAWLHQICALFNELRNDCDQAECTCPNCYINEVEAGERDPLPQNEMFCAKDLQRTILSDHIENRLVKRLKQERQDRADHSGKNFDEVLGAEGLVVRVVSSVDKKLEVKPRFLEIFQKENYPTEFPYKSKAILLFQKIEGVEVCIFGMFVQECGTECAFPNQRRVYLSYLDSVKYFRPEIKTVTGESLRTFVYHEILIGYLDYCKRRGFTSCYIWACPPNYKGNDYIFNCHPENQKTPKPVKLREWYRSMLKKAEKENIVVDQTTLHDYFFTKQGESRANVTATRLPYFDGDQLPEVAEGIITELLSPEEDDCMQQKGKMKKASITKDASYTNRNDNASMDAPLMEKLRKKLDPMREDLIMVHLQHPCHHCRVLMVSGTRWVCNTCDNFNLCDSCHKADQALETRERHPTQSCETHALTQVQINNVPVDTNDKDVVIENKLFDTPHTFLAQCQDKLYQFGTLRQAKHSSMMMLYHLIVENKD